MMTNATRETMRQRLSSTWTRPFAIAAVVACASLLAAPTADAAPGTILFEGFLRSPAGGPAADGKYNMSFSLYASEQAAVPLWNEAGVVVDVASGQMRYALGSSKALSPALLSANPGAWLQVQIANDPPLKRQRLHAVPYALVAGSVTSISCTGCVSLQALKIDGDLDLGNNSLKAGKVTAQSLSSAAIVAQTMQASVVKAGQFIGDGSHVRHPSRGFFYWHRSPMVVALHAKLALISSHDPDVWKSCDAGNTGLSPGGRRGRVLVEKEPP